ncbi:MAG: hypothetical protein LBN95_01125 [Prevotellaceae bacterium]|jgi:hypothetical protein|nr:hypothetical protein [Prevotellaceae bacterium]
MKKVYLVAALAAMSLFGAQAQKIKLAEGSLAFLKGEANLNVVFDYSTMLVDGKSEAKWVDAEVKGKNKEEAKKGDAWKKEWEGTYRTDNFEPRFINDLNGDLNGVLTAGEFPKAKYQATVKTVTIVPGTSAGPFSRAAVVAVDVIFTKVGSSEVLAKVTISKAVTNMNNLADAFVIERRIANAYGQAGEKLGEFIVKALKKVK